MKKSHWLLVALLAIQVGLAAFLYWPSEPAAGAERLPLFGDMEMDEISRFTILDNEGEQITIQKDGQAWVMPDADNYPCQDSKVVDFLQKVIALENGPLVTRTESSHRRLKVAEREFERRIDLTTFSGETSVLYVGSSPNYGSAHVRLEGKDETYLASDLSAYDVQPIPGNFVDTRYLAIPQNEIAKLTLRNNQGNWTLEQDKEGNWRLLQPEDSRELKPEAVNTLVSRVSTVNLLQPLGKEDKEAYGLEQPSAVVTIETENETIELRVGTKNPSDNSYIVKSSESDYFVKVTEFSVKVMVENGLEDFLLIEPTATPEGVEEEQGN